MKILSVDGGGVRGLIAARVVEDLERRVGRDLAECFDLMLGTSTGALVVAALATPLGDGRPRPAASLPGFYHQHCMRIFPMGRKSVGAERIWGLRDTGFHDQMLAGAQWFGSIFGGTERFAGGARHFDDGLETVLNDFFGDATLSQCLTGIRITSFDQTDNTAVVFSNSDPLPVKTALRASVAAPTYLPPLELNGRSLIDGGVWANNPVLVALPELLVDPASVIVSVGTGHPIGGVDTKVARTRGWPGQASGLLRMVTEGETTDFLIRRAVTADRYVRLQCILPAGVSMDDPSAGNLDRIDQVAAQLLRDHDADLDRTAERISN